MEDVADSGEDMNEYVETVLGETTVCAETEWVAYDLANKESIETTVA